MARALAWSRSRTAGVLAAHAPNAAALRPPNRGLRGRSERERQHEDVDKVAAHRPGSLPRPSLGDPLTRSALSISPSMTTAHSGSTSRTTTGTFSMADLLGRLTDDLHRVPAMGTGLALDVVEHPPAFRQRIPDRPHHLVVAFAAESTVATAPTLPRVKAGRQSRSMHMSQPGEARPARDGLPPAANPTQ